MDHFKDFTLWHWTTHWKCVCDIVEQQTWQMFNNCLHFSWCSDVAPEEEPSVTFTPWRSHLMAPQSNGLTSYWKQINNRRIIDQNQLNYWCFHRCERLLPNRLCSRVWRHRKRAGLQQQRRAGGSSCSDDRWKLSLRSDQDVASEKIPCSHTWGGVGASSSPLACRRLRMEGWWTERKEPNSNEERRMKILGD